MSMKATPGTVTIEQVDAATTYPLRGRVLRPGQPVEIAGDDDPATLHFVARVDGSGQVVGVLRLHPAPCPWPEASGTSRATWQLRGMATEPQVRGLGSGRALIAAGLARVAALGADLVWCDARAAAVGFYERMGFTVVTEEYQRIPNGPHVGMVVELPIR